MVAPNATLQMLLYNQITATFRLHIWVIDGQRFNPGNKKEALVCHSADNLLVMCMFLDR